MDAAYTAGQEAVLRSTAPAERSRLLGSLYTSLLPAVDARLFALEQLHAADPPAEHADIGPVRPAVGRGQEPAQPGGPAGPAAPAALGAAVGWPPPTRPVSAHLGRLFHRELDDARADHAASAGHARGPPSVIIGRRPRASAWPRLAPVARDPPHPPEPGARPGPGRVRRYPADRRATRTRRSGCCSGTWSARSRDQRRGAQQEQQRGPARGGHARCRPARRCPRPCAAPSRARAWRCGRAGRTGSTTGGRPCCPARCAPRCPAPRAASRSPSAAR